MNAKTPIVVTFRTVPAKEIDPKVEASPCVSGSHIKKGEEGNFIQNANLTKNKYNIT
jgi:hypothetical protein